MTGGLLLWNRSMDFLLILNSEAELHTGSMLIVNREMR
jgi:hypothetical protein